MASISNQSYVMSNQIANWYGRHMKTANEWLTKISSGKALSPKSNASTYAIVQKGESQLRAQEQAYKNIQNDNSLLKTAEGGVSSIIDILKTIKERAINAANDSNTNEDRGRIATEVQELVKQIDYVANNTTYNGKHLLNGVADTTTANIASSSSVADVTEPTAATEATGTPGASSVYSLTGLKKSDGTDADNTTTLVDMGFTAGDKITFSWKEDGTAKSKEIEVTDSTTLGDLEFTESKLDVSWQASATATALNDQGGNASGYTTTAGEAGLYAVGDKQVKISDFKVAVTDSDGATSAKQADMLFTGEQASTGVQASHTVYNASLSGLNDANSGGAATANTKLADLKLGSTNVGLNGKTIELSWKDENGTSQTDSLTDDGSKTLTDLFAKAGLTLVTGDGTSNLAVGGTEVTDKDGNPILTDNGALYAVSAAGEVISNLEFSVTSGTTDANTALNGIMGTNVQKAGDKAEDTTTEESTGGSVTFRFHIGADENLYTDVTINSLLSKDLFGDTDAFVQMFGDRDTARSAIDVIENALNKALDLQTQLGSTEASLGFTAEGITIMTENQEETISNMSDTDMAKAMVEFTRLMVLGQGANLLEAQSNKSGYNLLSLLQQ